MGELRYRATVKVDGGIGFDTKDAAALARADEEAGFAGIWCPETGHDPFLPLLLAAENTSRIELGTGIAVAFARNPLSMATVANDLHLHSKGRFLLGLGSQIKPHIEKRFSMPWSHPAARMREYVMAMRAIWSAWNEGTKLAFRGDFYTHTLMTPMFSPSPNPYGTPKVFVAGVGGLMTEVAGEVADGFLVHGFTTERYLRDVTLPALERGLARSGRKLADIEISYPGMVVTGSTEEEISAALQAVKIQLAFYGSTPAYRPVLEHSGWGDLQSELNTLSKRGEWVKMAELIDDGMVSAFAAVGPPDEIPGMVLLRFGDVVDRFSFYAPYKPDPKVWQKAFSGG
jgi:probable F420-dependent oxidoreductase